MVKHKLGVLFVHGIGSQEQGETLVSVGEPLAACLSEIAPASPSGTAPPFQINDATVVSGADERGSSYARWTVSGTSWLVAESWWSQTFRKPSYARMALWTLRVAPWTLALHFKTQLSRAKRLDPRSKDWGVLASPRASLFLLYFLTALVVAPVLAATIILMLVLGWIPKVRDFALAIQRVLAGSLGDSYVWLNSPIQRAAIEARVRRDLVSLSNRCERVAVIAHSQGAAIAHSVVRASAPENVTLLTTMGSGLSKLWALRRAQESGEVAWTWLASAGAILGIAATPSLLRTVASVGVSKVLLGVAGYVAGVAAVMVFWPGGNAVRSWKALARQALAIIAGLAAVFSLLWVLWPVMNAMRPVAWAGLGGFLLLTFALGSGNLLREPSTEEFEQDFQLPAGIRWIDFYSEHDLVPTGQLVEKPPAGALESHRVDNLGSMLSDHTSYWQNPEGVVARVVAALLAAADLTGPDEGVLARGERRRRYRVGWLVLVRTSMSVAALAIIAWHWRNIHRVMPTPALDLLRNSLPRSSMGEPLAESVAFTASRAVGIGAVLLTALVSYQALLAMWTWWGRSDRSRFQNQASYAPAPAWFWVFVIAASVLVEAGTLIPLFPLHLFDALKISAATVFLTALIGYVAGLQWRALLYAAMVFLLTWPTLMFTGPDTAIGGFWTLFVLLAQIPVAKLIKRSKVQDWLRRITAA